MLTQEHALIGLIVSIILYPIFGFSGVLVIFLANIFIDIDHIVGYWMCYKKIDLNPINWYKNCMKLPEGPWTPLHSIELILLIALFSVIYNYYFIIIGILIHTLTDYLDEPGRLKVRFWLSYLAINRKF